MKVAAKSAAKAADVIEVALAASSALRPKADSAFRILKIDMREYCFVKSINANALEDLDEPDTSSAMHQNVNLMLADPPSSTRKARGQASSTHDVLCKKIIEDAERFMSSLRAA